MGSIPGSGRCPGEGNGNPLQRMPGESHGQRSLAGYSPRGHKESDTTERLTLSLSQYSPPLLLILPLSRFTCDGPAQGCVAITLTGTAAGPPRGALRPIWTRPHLLFKTSFPGSLAKHLSLTLDWKPFTSWPGFLFSS